MNINKDGIDYSLSPYQTLILYGLAAILARLMGSEGKRHGAIGIELLEAARSGFCKGNLQDKFDKHDHNRL